MAADSRIELRLQSLEDHLKIENPVLNGIVGSFRTLDRITRRIGFFHKDQSHTYRMTWWPLISVLGTYSSGKSAFINFLLNYRLQPTGNQAVDDKFTVICYTSDRNLRVLPGLSLDADPRFPLYKVSRAIEAVAEGEGRNIDNYLQLKTCSSDVLRGRILIDSPGFDADAQRAATLRITNHIIELSDLVLVFFDARHPEVGSMPHTLEHLVRETISHRDVSKFVFILNQMDNTAREDNPEEVFAAWQRALSHHGLTAGSCFAIYNPELAVPIEDEKVRSRLERRREQGYRTIVNRMEQVAVERAYRIVGMLRESAGRLERDIVPTVTRYTGLWRRATLFLDALVFGLFLILLTALFLWPGVVEVKALTGAFATIRNQHGYLQIALLLLLLGGIGYMHHLLRRRAAKWAGRKLLSGVTDPALRDNYARAFGKSSRWYRSIFRRHPAGWGRRARRSLAKVFEEVDAYIRKLNDAYTNPSGSTAPAVPAEPASDAPSGNPGTNP
jgi:hypothetical protein